jgi:hypothetical protein
MRGRYRRQLDERLRRVPVRVANRIGVLLRGGELMDRTVHVYWTHGRGDFFLTYTRAMLTCPEEAVTQLLAGAS